MNVIVDSAAALLKPCLIWLTTRIDSVSWLPFRAAAGQDVRQVVDAQRVQGAEQDGDHQRRLHQRQRDQPEPLPGGGAVDLGRLVDLGGDHLQPGEDQQRHERRGLPDVGDDDRAIGPATRCRSTGCGCEAACWRCRRRRR